MSLDSLTLFIPLWNEHDNYMKLPFHISTNFMELTSQLAKYKPFSSWSGHFGNVDFKKAYDLNI